jgi:hypothetical protein
MIAYRSSSISTMTINLRPGDTAAPKPQPVQPMTPTGGSNRCLLLGKEENPRSCFETEGKGFVPTVLEKGMWE